MSLWYVRASFDYMPRNGIAGSWGRWIPHFLRKHHINFQSACTNLNFTSNRGVSSLFHILSSTRDLFLKFSFKFFFPNENVCDRLVQCDDKLFQSIFFCIMKNYHLTPSHIWFLLWYFPCFSPVYHVLSHNLIFLYVISFCIYGSTKNDTKYMFNLLITFNLDKCSLNTTSM